jgi:phosphopantothenoylcysteine decarboxylase / phosphopantothenate---cysteine ligase
MFTNLRNKKIIIGVCGSIAAYKAVFLCRLLIREGAEVKVVLTESAATFVAPLTFSTLSKNPVFYQLSDANQWNNHVELGFGQIL